MTEKTLIEEIQNTQKQLETLSAEQSDLGKKMAIAADDADSASLISLAHRRNELPIQISSEQIRLQQLLLRRDEQRLPELQKTVAKLAEPIATMRQEIDEKQREFNIKSGEVSSANEDLRQLRLEIAERKRAIEGLLAQARNTKISPAYANAGTR